ncbi:sugar phosphate isomerase/epimerase family protein [Bradyrhizobium sp. LHD-71]|uniref:sugar phosphate isomerase/epimerase family protein n=1 Tax=Bradyrhizobium sp. LHD-71 TaxID=3072141 RepID=UPI00280CA2E4|nr:sugar phosphate isomerase/epimerase family protein [Bradyrhizobium sp. LHD-71]MDQ8732267.1 sugar phosphate isomerase/epimerase family protein [Bradyrhizobium sp. LHD-71]
MPAPAKPVLGAALSTASLSAHREWLLSRPRDLELQDFFRSDVLDGDWQDVAARLKKSLDGFEGRLGIHGPFWGFKIDSHDPLVRNAVRTRMLQGLEAAEAVGATQMVIHSPYTTWDHNNLDLYPGNREASIERVQATLSEVIRRAEQIGCELVIENIEDKDPHERVRLAKALNSKNVRVSLDTGHAHYAYTSTGAPPVDYYVDAAGDMLTHVHIQDSDGYADRHWAPGEGTIRWGAVFRALGQLTSNPRLIIELRDHGTVLAGARHLTELGLAE